MEGRPNEVVKVFECRVEVSKSSSITLVGLGVVQI